eukprot:562853-Rhodomonas_salina.2
MLYCEFLVPRISRPIATRRHKLHRRSTVTDPGSASTGCLACDPWCEGSLPGNGGSSRHGRGRAAVGLSQGLVTRRGHGEGLPVDVGATGAEGVECAAHVSVCCSRQLTMVVGVNSGGGGRGRKGRASSAHVRGMFEPPRPSARCAARG